MHQGAKNHWKQVKFSNNTLLIDTYGGLVGKQQAIESLSISVCGRCGDRLRGCSSHSNLGRNVELEALELTANCIVLSPSQKTLYQGMKTLILTELLLGQLSSESTGDQVCSLGKKSKTSEIVRMWREWKQIPKWNRLRVTNLKWDWPGYHWPKGGRGFIRHFWPGSNKKRI